MAMDLDPLVIARLPAPHMLLPGETDAYYGYGLLRFNYRGVAREYARRLQPRLRLDDSDGAGSSLCRDRADE